MGEGKITKIKFQKLYPCFRGQAFQWC